MCGGHSTNMRCYMRAAHTAGSSNGLQQLAYQHSGQGSFNSCGLWSQLALLVEVHTQTHMLSLSLLLSPHRSDKENPQLFRYLA